MSAHDQRLTLTVDGEWVTLSGTVKGDATHRELTSGAWKWSRTAGAYVLPRSLRPDTRDGYVTRLRMACERLGVPLTVEDTGVTVSEAERRANRAERLEARADRLEVSAERQAAVRDAAWSAGDAISEGIPFGQPILMGHHSQRRAERDRDRIIALGQKGLEAHRASEDAARRAENIRVNLERGESAVTIGNRIERAEAEVRRIGRELAEYASNGGRPDGGYPVRLTAERDRLVEAIELDRATIAAMVESGAVRVFSKDTVRKGDAVLIRGQWRIVVRANTKTVACDSGYSWTDNSPWREVKGHRTAAQLAAGE